MSDASIPIPTAIAKWAKRAFDAEKERDRLRTEKAELVKNAQAVGAYASAIEAATIERCAQLCDSFEEPHMARLIRKLAKAANETDRK